MGDGMLTALVMTKVISETGRSLAELAGVVKKMPQVLVNAEVSEDTKRKFQEGEMAEMVGRYERELGERGWKLLVRASGTEPLIRVTIWGDDVDGITREAEDIAKKIKEF